MRDLKIEILLLAILSSIEYKEYISYNYTPERVLSKFLYSTLKFILLSAMLIYPYISHSREIKSLDKLSVI